MRPAKRAGTKSRYAAASGKKVGIVTNVFINGEVSIEEAERITSNYSPSVQETADETPESVDNSPITDDERRALDKATEPTFQPVLGEQPTDRAPQYQIPGEWVSPIVKQRQKNAMLLPNIGQVNDLDQRISAVMRFDGAPKEVATLAQKARVAVGTARTAHESGRHPESRRFAASQAAKDAAVQEIAKATTVVAALEQAATREDIRQQWFDGLTSGLEDQRKAAATALDKAAKAYAAWRQSIAAADALAKEQGRWGDWHNHPQARELNPLGLIGEIRKARDIAHSDDDFISGAYLTTDYGDEIPPHTMAYLEAAARLVPGSFVELTFHRLKSPHPRDDAARYTILHKDLRIINTEPVPDLMPTHENER